MRPCLKPIRPLLLLLLPLVIACQPHPNAKAIVDRAIEQHGGTETWQRIKTIKFDKTSILYFPDGKVESKVTQHQSFQYHPTYMISIRWEQDDKDFLITSNGDHVAKSVNDSIVTDPKALDAAKKSVLASEYVIFLPFKLKDDNTALHYAGTATFNNDEAHLINTTFSEKRDNADQWTFYFERDSYQLLGYKVVHNGKISLVESLETNTDTGLLLDAHRKSYFLDSLGNKEYLRAEFFYESFQILY
ncbi:DUF6503 family protein [Sungkyunkwania multivorans]|uniref:DUF6503 family protein n=1 Tax=Sungkyunkwania multivorans TaxID=1173618 RepID=A0ABW3CYU0_9FLAO